MSVVLTKSRFINALRCYFGYALNRLGSALFHSPFSIHHSPIFISVEPANICQLRCPECPVGRGENHQSPITNHQSPITNHQSPIIDLQVLRLRSNEHEWRAFKQQYKLFGADRLVFKTAQLYDYQNGHPLMPTNPKYSRYILGKDGKYHRRKLRKGCFRVWSGAVITTNGDVLPCCYDKSHAYAYGNIMEKPLRELFTNDKALAFRQAAFRQTPQICQECWK